MKNSEIQSIGNESDEITLLELLIVILSIYSLIALAVQVTIPIDAELDILLDRIDWVVCGIFFFDFIYRFIRADNKLDFMKWGWIDLLASIPTVDPLRGLRLIRILKLFKVVRSFKAVKILLRHILRDPTKSAVYSVLSVSLLMVFFGSIAVLVFEAPFSESNIRNAEDAVWWSFVTITTVGYGDYYPVSWEGRMVAAVLMTTGVGLFGTFTGLIASYFVVAGEDTQETEIRALRHEMLQLNSRLAALLSEKT